MAAVVRWWPLTAAVLVVLLLVPWLTHAQPVQQEAPEGPLPYLFGVDLEVAYRLQFGAMETTDWSADSCSAGELLAQEDRITFRKGRGPGPACAEVEHDVPFPAVATVVKVEATQELTADGEGAPVGRLRILMTGSESDEHHEVACGFGGRGRMSGDVTCAASLPSDIFVPKAKAVWRFEWDCDPCDSSPLEEGNLTVDDVILRHERLPVSRGGTVALDKIGNASTGLMSISAPVPEHLLSSAHSLEHAMLNFRFDGLVDVVEIHLPNGTKVPRTYAHYPAVVDHQVIQVPVDPEAGPGSYGIVFRDGRFYQDGTAGVEARDPVKPAVAIEISVLAASVGIVPLASAWLAVRTQRSALPGAAAGTVSRPLGQWLIVVGAAVYLLLAVVVLRQAGFGVLVVWPLAGSAWLFYAATLVSALLFLTIWLRSESARDAQVKKTLDVQARALDDGAAKAAELESLLQGVSHDLKTPLIALDWLAKDLEADIHRADPATVAELMARIRSNVGGMEDLVGELLELQSVSAGAAPDETVDLAKVRVSVRDELLDAFRARAARYEERVDDDVHVRMTSGHARRILRNLLSNALKYGRPTGGTVRLTLRSAGHGQERRVEIIVDDDGPGVDPDQRSAIFDMFKRGTGNEAVEGTGVGLALVKRIAECSGGSVEVSDSPLGGARFHVVLPYASDAPSPQGERT